MNAIRRAIARARRRVLLQGFIRILGWAVLIAIGVSAVVIVVGQLLALPTPLWSFLVLAGVAGVASATIAMTRRYDPVTIAAMLDHRLGLKDSIGTAIYAESLGDHPFAKQVLADGQAKASDARVNAAFPIRPGQSWAWIPPAAGVLAVLVFFTPSDIFDRAGQEAQAALGEEAAEAAEEQIVQAKTLIRDIETREKRELETDPTAIMEELATLSRERLNTPQGKKEALAKLSKVQDKLEAAKNAKEVEFKAMKNAMSGLDADKKGPADRFADALRRGDFEQAQKELEEIAEKVKQGQYSPQQKQQLQQQLQQMSKSLQQMQQQAQQKQQQAQQQMQKQLQQQGFSQQQAQQMAQQFQNGQMSQQQMQQQIQQQLQQQGMSQQQAQKQAQQAAQQMQQQKQQAQSQGQCGSCAGGLSQSLQQMAQGMQQSQQGQQGQSQTQQGAHSAQQQMAQMAQMQQQMQQMGQAQQQLYSAMQKLNQGQGQGQGQGNGQQGQQGGGPGGRKAGTGSGGNPYGTERAAGQQATHAARDIQDGQGRVIASWLQYGENAAGESNVEFDTTVTNARDEAERAVADDRVPRRYHEAIREYFNQLPETAEAAKRAPAAPN